MDMKGRYTVILEENENGVWTARVPALKGCVSQGDTPQEALENVKEAIQGHLESLMQLNKPIPVEVEVEIPA